MAKSVDNKGETKESNVIVVDVDEKSLNALGQWPWPRVIVAKLLSEVDKAHPTTIGFDIIFPEKDRTSPSEISKFYEKFFHLSNPITTIPQELRDNDKILSSVLERSSSVMSVYLSNESVISHKCSKLNSLKLNRMPFELRSYKHILCNTPTLHTTAPYSGFVNTKIDSDGILRRVPLFMEYNNIIVPALPMAILLNIDSNIKIGVHGDIDILDHRIQSDKKSQVLLNFYKDSWYKKVSAIDVLNGKFKEKLLGKIVIVGSSATALHDQIVVTGGQKVVGVKVHVTMIDNILNDKLILQSDKYKYINILVSLFLSFLLFFLLIKKHNLSIITLFAGTIVLSIVATFIAYENNIYIAIGYLIGPFLFHFFLVGFLFIIIDAYERQMFVEELNRSHIALLDSMVYVAEVHDIETGAHILRTKLYIKILAEYMYDNGIYKKHLSPKKIEMMYRTAPLHDLGKVGIEDVILKKKGKLSPMEYEVMKTHADLGRHIINNAISSYKENEFFVMARNIAHYHHEKWDGTGYPTGLKEEEIPLEARFMAIADVFDALVSRRVYKEPFTYEKTLQIIKEGRGKYFDPVLVDAFFEIKEQFIKIAEIYSDENY